ncbi:MAG: serine hydroxymethyltransferase, partial [Opitutales bacterium]
MSLNQASLAELDPAIHKVLEDEKKRQQTHIELIASENFTLPAIMEA